VTVARRRFGAHRSTWIRDAAAARESEEVRRNREDDDAVRRLSWIGADSNSSTFAAADTCTAVAVGRQTV
jgi:hypothetical protein